MENLSPNSMPSDWYRHSNSVQKVTGLIREQRINDADILTIALATSVQKPQSNTLCPRSVNKYSDDADIISASCGNLPEDVNRQLFQVDHPMEEEYSPPVAEEVFDLPVEDDVAVPVIDKNKLKIQLKTSVATAIDYQFISILNKGSYEELIQLRGIGPVRANRIIEERQNTPFSSTHDLENVGMKSKEIQKFISDNVQYLLQ